jgi:hypothetical protein
MQSKSGTGSRKEGYLPPDGWIFVGRIEWEAPGLPGLPGRRRAMWVAATIKRGGRWTECIESGLVE